MVNTSQSYTELNTPVAIACLTVLISCAILGLLKWVASKRKRTPKPANVFIIDDFDDCDRKLKHYREKYPYLFNFLGLDCEWVNRKDVLSHPVALLQIATPLNNCFLIRLCKMSGGLPPSLRHILEDKNILKFGVGILDDAKKLRNTFGVIVSGCVDLRHLALRCQPRKECSSEKSKGQGKMSLGALAQRILGVQMDKAWHVQCSNWEAEQLSDRQVMYAANDAIVAVHLFMALVEMKRNEKMAANGAKLISSVDNQGIQAQNINPGVHIDDQGTPQSITSGVHSTDETIQNILDITEDYAARTIYLEKLETDASKGYIASPVNLVADETFCKVGVSLCKGIVDIGFKLKQKSAKKAENDASGRNQKPYRTGYTERKTPLYTNCQLVAPDGAVLSTIERRKADWYLDKGIGEPISEDPYTVRLKFEPSGRPHEDDSYYLTFKENICVVCGQSGSYLRKNVVPHEYRRHFPLCMKDHHSHDIVLMCPECHRLSTYYDEHLRQRLAREYDAPLGNKEVARLVQDPVLMKVRSAAKALVYAGDKLPSARRKELVQILQDYYNTSDLSPELIREASAIEIHRENANFKSHGEEVVKRVKEQRKLLEFEKMWRSHFVDSLNPQHLPEFWSVDHRFEKMKAALDKLELDDAL